MSNPDSPRAFRSLGSTLSAHFFLKTGGVSAFMVVFFLAYFWVLHHPLQAVVTMPLTAVDRVVPFAPWAEWLYFSLWVYVSLCAGLTADKRVLAIYGLFAGLVAVIGLGIFFAWPTAVPQSHHEWADHPSLAFLKTIDQTGNACPSLHVAYAVFSALWTDSVFRSFRVRPLGRWANVLWCVGIVYSTIAIRQHVFIDVLAGGALGGVVALAMLGVCRRLEEAEKKPTS